MRPILNISTLVSTKKSSNTIIRRQTRSDITHHTVISTDLRGKIRTFNTAVLTQLGYSAEELFGQDVSALLHAPEEIANHAQQLSKELQVKIKPGFEALAAKARRGITEENDLTYIRKDGSRYPVRLLVTPLHDNADIVSGFLCIGKEVAKHRSPETIHSNNETLFRNFIDSSPIETFIKDEEGRMVYVNEIYERRFNMTADDWKGKTDFELWGEENGRLLRDHDLEVLTKGEAVSFFEEGPTLDGNLTYWQSYKVPLTDMHGQRFLGGMSLNVTTQRQSAQELRQNAEQYREIIDSTTDFIHSVSPDGQLLYSNRAWQEALGYAQEEVPRLSLTQVIHPDSYAQYMQIFTRVVGGETVSNYETAFITKDGRKIVVEGNSSCKFQDGWPIATRSIFRDVTTRKHDEAAAVLRQRQIEEAKAELEQLSLVDILTRTQNRRAFEENLNREVARAARQKTALSLLLLDIDHFKQHNDVLGLSAGNSALQQFAHLLTETPRCTDMIARYGGDEFAVILPDTAREGAMISAERFRQRIESASWNGRNLTVSIGVSTFEPSDTVPNSTLNSVLFEEADKALYQSKCDGRNRVTHHDG